MQEIAISKFKATCLAVLEDVRKTQQPIRVTRFGKPVADIQPPAIDKPERIVLGGMEGTIEILGDIVGPSMPEEDWDALRK